MWTFVLAAAMMLFGFSSNNYVDIHDPHDDDVDHVDDHHHRSRNTSSRGDADDKSAYAAAEDRAVVATVSQLFIYPVKSCAAVRVVSAWVGLYGFEYDRLWIVIEDDSSLLREAQDDALQGNTNSAYSAPSKVVRYLH
jgi:hypothetical protein